MTIETLTMKHGDRVSFFLLSCTDNGFIYLNVELFPPPKTNYHLDLKVNLSCKSLSPPVNYQFC